MTTDIPPSIEQMCRDLLDRAIADRIVTFRTETFNGQTCPQELSSGEIVGMANLLASYFAADVRRYRAAVEACRGVFADIDDRYDGADDSSTRWMGEQLDRLRAVLADAEREGGTP